MRDIQPWHGFAFELHLDAWKDGAAADALTASLVTTHESDCGPPGSSGSRERICGGGLWSPGGHAVIPRGDSFEVVVAAGNGQLDLTHKDYANTLLRLEPGLDFDPKCDEAACADFNPDQPQEACVASCENLFVPRLAPGDAPLRPESGVCDGLTQYECWQQMDYIGGGTPAYTVLPSGTEVLVYPTKEGTTYLVDANHLGRMYDREVLVSVCGTPDDPCWFDWAGMAVTTPEIVQVGEHTVALIATFMGDNTHPAGVVALRIVDDPEGPRLERLWEAPSFDSPLALKRFRYHSSRIRLHEVAKDVTLGWVVDLDWGDGRGDLLGIRADTGQIVAAQPLVGPGYRYVRPLLLDDTVYAVSCRSDNGPSWLEAYDVSAHFATR